MNVHRLPEVVPAGWHRDNGRIVRHVNGTELAAWPDGDRFGSCAYMWPSTGEHLADSLPEACQAAERAYCGAYVGQPLEKP